MHYQVLFRYVTELYKMGGIYTHENANIKFHLGSESDRKQLSRVVNMSSSANLLKTSHVLQIS